MQSERDFIVLDGVYVLLFFHPLQRKLAKVVCLRVSGTAWSLSPSSRSQSSMQATAWRSSRANCPKTTGALTAISSLLISLLLSGLESIF